MQRIEEIYRTRLRMLASEAGSQRALADRTGKSPAQISQWINASADSKSGKPRAMDRATAREIERRFPKPDGWMDQPVIGIGEELQANGQPVKPELRWPFPNVDLEKVLGLAHADVLRLEGAVLLSAGQLSLDVAMKRRRSRE
ncbi:MAG: hypothetical protein EON54_17440 [Alcaligenaceae bacterium]|nr:MAG: hypothetical protein EON54_17440 [Alcaligenaceae bacterium]